MIAALAVDAGLFPLLIIGMFVFGAGIAAERLARYAAADITPPSRQAFAISLVVWAGTVGSVLGPVLLEPAKRLATSLGLEGLAGPFLIATAGSVVAVAVIERYLRPDPLSFVASVSPRPAGGRAGRVAGPKARAAIVALLIGQVVMVLIMTMTPIHIDRAGDGLGTIGLIIAAHTFGMFALSPVTGWVADRVGRPRVILAGHVLLLIAALAAANATGDATARLFFALFLLGVGWNFSFIAGSAYLTQEAPAEMRVRLEGLADTVVWSSGAAAGLSSGVLLEASNYTVLCLVGAAMVALPAVAAFRFRRTLRRPAYATEGG